MWKWNSKKSLMLSIILTDIFLLLLAAGAISLPWIVTWYVEVRHRSQSLPTTIMLVAYPCLPFAAAVLFTLRGILKDIKKNNVFTAKNCARLKRISWCCFAVALIMVFSGRFYLPFYVCAVCTAFIGLILRIIRNILMTQLPEIYENGGISFGRVGILGDSYSTYMGFIPEGNNAWYGEEEEDKSKTDVWEVEQTWWYPLLKETGSELVENNSFSGSTIGSIGYDGSDASHSSYVTRMKQSFIGKHKYDTVFIFGGTNDTWAGTPVGELKYSDWQDEDLKQTIPSFCCVLDTVMRSNPKAKVINIINDIIKPEITEPMKEACRHYGVDCIQLKDIAKDNGHPNIAGMAAIREQIKDFYKK